jgi:hypothetical protein
MRTLYRGFYQGAVKWRLYLSDADDPELKPLGKDQGACEGSTMFGESGIVINRGLPARERAPVLIHELVHAAFHSSGIGHSLGLNMKKEEMIAHAIAPFIAQALVTGGFWKTPRGEE